MLYIGYKIMASAPCAVHYTSNMELFEIQLLVQDESSQADVKQAVMAKQIPKHKGMKKDTALITTGLLGDKVIMA